MKNKFLIIFFLIKSHANLTAPWEIERSEMSMIKIIHIKLII